MPFNAPHRFTRRTALTTALVLTAALAAPASGFAADPPTVGLPTIIPAGQKSPIDVPGNHLMQHATIRRGMALVRFPVTMHGKSSVSSTLSCPGTMVQSGTGVQEGSKIYPAPVPGSRYYERTVDVHFVGPPKVDLNGATGHVYLLCRDMAIAPLPSVIGFPYMKSPGQRSPVDIPGAHLHQGAKIRGGTQLARFAVALRHRGDSALTLTCPRATVVRAVGWQEGSKIGFQLAKGATYGQRTLKVRLSPLASSTFNETRGSIYALCVSR
jgi:hypothetical protein